MDVVHVRRQIPGRIRSEARSFGKLDRMCSFRVLLGVLPGVRGPAHQLSLVADAGQLESPRHVLGGLYSTGVADNDSTQRERQPMVD